MRKTLFVSVITILLVPAASPCGICLAEPGGGAADQERLIVQAPAADGQDYFAIDSAAVVYSISRPTPWIVVLSPNGGEEWCAGSTHDVLWNCFEVGSVRIDYSIWTGSDWTWSPVTGSTPCAPGSYSWTLPGGAMSGTQVRICGLPSDYPCDQSNGSFSIINCFPGDVTGDYVVDLADLVFLINYLFRSGDAPDPLANGDVTADCVVDLADLVYLVNYLYKNGDPPQIGCA
jgi:hypothetical protein